jgi:four helix bundle protein
LEIGDLESRLLADAVMNANATKAIGLERRFISFAGQIIKICPKLRRTVEGRHISSQILRSSTAVPANYAEARGAESRSDFIHKLGIVLKELNETAVWLQLINETSLLPLEDTEKLLGENQELCRIIAASIKTSRAFRD